MERKLSRDAYSPIGIPNTFLESCNNQKNVSSAHIVTLNLVSYDTF